MVRNIGFSFFVLIQPFLLPSKSSRSPKTTPTPPIDFAPSTTPSMAAMDLVAQVCFPASILTSTASSHFSCGALEFQWVIKYTLLASSSTYHSPMAPATTHPFSIRCVKLWATR
ncbi:uncharacterized protein LOC111890711 [Lactuca sativa]|uniref:uncharacterized protein LOC111890711 n=1 Tax=Lactuca sativa TaxID=4236 RepID=UPI001C689E0C|nr:uncharacterized protein LOC111890711 [Lactuca sativa]